MLSPDGRWLAYEAREGEEYEGYVRPFPNVNDGRFQMSQGGGHLAGVVAERAQSCSTSAALLASRNVR